MSTDGDSRSPLPSGRRCAAADVVCSSESCRDVPLASFGSMHISSPSLGGDEADRPSRADSASTCASSDAGDGETSSLPAAADDRAVEDEAQDADGEAEAHADDAQDVSGGEEELQDPARRQLLVTALGKVLVHLSSLGCRPQRATGFHAVCPPPLSISAYLERIDHYYHCSDQCLVLGLVYIDRIVNLQPEFVVSPLNVHRLVAVGTMVAAKFWDDVFYSNEHYARVAGVKLAEMNALEALFLKLLGWRLVVDPNDYRTYRGQILMAVRRGAVPAPAGPAPTSGVPRSPLHASRRVRRPPGSSEPWPP